MDRAKRSKDLLITQTILELWDSELRTSAPDPKVKRLWRRVNPRKDTPYEVCLQNFPELPWVEFFSVVLTDYFVYDPTLPPGFQTDYRHVSQDILDHTLQQREIDSPDTPTLTTLSLTLHMTLQFLPSLPPYVRPRLPDDPQPCFVNKMNTAYFRRQDRGHREAIQHLAFHAYQMGRCPLYYQLDAETGLYRPYMTRTAPADFLVPVRFLAGLNGLLTEPRRFIPRELPENPDSVVEQMRLPTTLWTPVWMTGSYLESVCDRWLAMRDC